MALLFSRIRDHRRVHPLLRGQYVFQVQEGGAYYVHYWNEMTVKLAPQTLAGKLDPPAA